MNLNELERLQRIYKDSVNLWVAASRDGHYTPEFVETLRANMDAAERRYNEAWDIYQAQKSK